jgi:hypothetical protein
MKLTAYPSPTLRYALGWTADKGMHKKKISSVLPAE